MQGFWSTYQIMAGEIRIYRRFRILTFSNSGGTTVETYTAMNPQSLRVDVYDVTTGNSLVESGATVINEATGLYYADLNPMLYNSDDIYEVHWYVTYNGNSGEKLQYTRFKFKMQPLVGREIEVEIMNNNPLEYTVINNHFSNS